MMFIDVVYILLYLNYETYMKLLNYYGDVVGEFSYMLLVLNSWCKHVLKYFGVDC